MTKHYERITCTKCQGHGQVANYGAFGLDFEGPDECPDCEGTGTIVRYASGALARYPGGPFLGRDPRTPTPEQAEAV